MKNRNKILVALIALTLFSCSAGTDDADTANAVAEKGDLIVLSPETMKKNGIESGYAESLRMANRINCTGSIEVPPQFLASLHTPVKGFVRSVRAIQGDHLHKGDVIAVLDHPEFARTQRSLLESKARLDFLKKELTRKEALRTEDAISVRELEQIEAEKNAEQATFNALQSELQLSGFNVAKILKDGVIQHSLNIISPFNGYLSRLNINMGKLVQPEDLIAEIVNTEHLHLELHVYAKDIAFVKKDQKIEFHIAGADSVSTATVYLISKTIDPQNNTVMVHAHLDDDQQYVAGTFVNGFILADERLTKVVPLQAIVKEAGKSYVFVRSGEGFVKAEVHTGFANETHIEIVKIEGYGKDAELIVKGAYYMESGSEE